MKRKTARLKLNWREADQFISAVHSQKRVTGLTHDFYKYPARFSPEFSRATIEVFSRPGDHVVDPFVGGGTTLVEARASGRLGVGSDISTLANFVTKAKSRVYECADIAFATNWIANLPDFLNLRNEVSTPSDWVEAGYFRNLNSRQTWALRKSIELGVMHASHVANLKRQSLIRCILLRSAQWALDGRRKFPSASEFRSHVLKNSEKLLDGAVDFRLVARRSDRSTNADGKARSVCIHGRAKHLAKFLKLRNREIPKLVVTSPPYPGVHVLYHRWQIHGGRETPAPFWIADKLDGAGTAHYLMSARQPGLEKYFNGILESFKAVRSIVDDQTTIIQLVAFSEPDEQLPKYLDVMEKAGFREYLLSEHVDSSDGRLWREVPSRKWHANSKGTLASGREAVLIHRSK